MQRSRRTAWTLKPELIMEDAASLLEAMRRMVGYTSDATELLDARIEPFPYSGKIKESEEFEERLAKVEARLTGSGEYNRSPRAR